MRKILLVPVLAFCSLLLVASLRPDLGPRMGLFWAYGADAQNNDITYVEVWQNNGSYQLVYNFTSSGGSTTINDAQAIRFNVSMRCNSTTFPTSGDVLTYTSCYMNITYTGPTYVWNNVSLNSTTPKLVGSYYYVVYQGDWNSSLPVAGTTYNCSVLARWRY